MSLSQFIQTQLEPILVEWEEFARRNAPSQSKMTALALRDHAGEILLDVARDLAGEQSAAEQFTKSQGDSDETGPRHAATVHGALRQANDFSLLQLSAEFRALRATVLRLWLPTEHVMTDAVVADMVRFNEAIDQALAQSIVSYSERADLTRELFLAVLGHDLRSPLANVAMVGEMLTRADLKREQVHDLGMRTTRSARFMKHMVDDLLGYTRVQMGRGIPTTRAECDVGDALRAAVTDAGASFPEARFELSLHGDVHGLFDSIRVQQLVTNLLVNAVQHGGTGLPVGVTATGDAEGVVICVTNHGKPIAPSACELIFQPLVQLPDDDSEIDDSNCTSLGLGLYIAREIAQAHAGTIAVTSSEAQGTVFEVVLPRNPPSADTDA